ncbi:MAG: response regulator [Planctomycetota bacterium]
MKKILTTGDVAKLCCVTVNTVVKWGESGELEMFRVPCSGARRFNGEKVIEFLKKHGFPYPQEEAKDIKVLVIDDEPEIRSVIKQALSSEEGFKVEEAASAFEGGLKAVTFNPDVILLDSSVMGISNKFSDFIKQNETLSNTKFVSISGSISQNKARQLKENSVLSGYIRKPFTITDVKKVIFKCVEQKS